MVVVLSSSRLAAHQAQQSSCRKIVEQVSGHRDTDVRRRFVDTLQTLGWCASSSSTAPPPKVSAAISSLSSRTSKTKNNVAPATGGSTSAASKAASSSRGRPRGGGPTALPPKNPQKNAAAPAVPILGIAGSKHELSVFVGKERFSLPWPKNDSSTSKKRPNYVDAALGGGGGGLREGASSDEPVIGSGRGAEDATAAGPVVSSSLVSREYQQPSRTGVGTSSPPSGLLDVVDENPLADDATFAAYLKEVLASKQLLKVYHNFSWHKHVLDKNLGAKNLNGLHADVMHMARLLGKEVRGFPTDAPAQANVIERFEELAGELQAVPWGESNWDFLRFYRTHWLELAPTLAEIETRGVGLDCERLASITHEATQQRDAAERRFRAWLQWRFTEERVAQANVGRPKRKQAAFSSTVHLMNLKSPAQLEKSVVLLRQLLFAPDDVLDANESFPVEAKLVDAKDLEELRSELRERLSNLLELQEEMREVRAAEEQSALEEFHRKEEERREQEEAKKSRREEKRLRNLEKALEAAQKQAEAAGCADIEQKLAALYEEIGGEAALRSEEQLLGGGAEEVFAAGGASKEVVSEDDAGGHDSAGSSSPSSSPPPIKKKPWAPSNAQLDLWYHRLRENVPADKITVRSKLKNKQALQKELEKVSQLIEDARRDVDDVVDGQEYTRKIDVDIPGLLQLDLGSDQSSLTPTGMQKVSNESLRSLLVRERARRLEELQAAEQDSGVGEEDGGEVVADVQSENTTGDELDAAASEMDGNASPSGGKKRRRRRQSTAFDEQHEVSRLKERLAVDVDGVGVETEGASQDCSHQTTPDTFETFLRDGVVFDVGYTFDKLDAFDPSLLEYLEISSTLNGYLRPLHEYARKAKAEGAENPRVYVNLNLYTETGRLSCRQPNLQNIPTASNRYPIRSCFRAGAGRTFVIIDYSQLELRVLAHLANCPVMSASFLQGGDFHSRAAALMFPHVREASLQGGKNGSVARGTTSTGEESSVVFNKKKGAAGGTSMLTSASAVNETEDFDLDFIKKNFPEERKRAKTLNFSVVYGVTKFGLDKLLNLPGGLDEAQEVINLWYEKFPAVKRWQRTQVQFARDHGFVETLMGRRRPVGLNETSAAAQKGPEREPQVMGTPASSKSSTTEGEQSPNTSDSSAGAVGGGEGLFSSAAGADGSADSSNSYSSTSSARQRSRSPTSRGGAGSSSSSSPTQKRMSAGHRKHLERVAINTPVQGSAADIVNCAMVELHKSRELKQLGFVQVLQIHDELILEGPVEHAAEAESIIKRIAERPSYVPMNVPLVVNSEVRDTWG